jgi:hypothetical protein
VRFACAHCFEIEAQDERAASALLTDLVCRISAASSRLDVGFVHTHATCQPQPGAPEPPVDDPERLFDV